MRMVSQVIIDAKDAVKLSDEAKDAFKSKMPEKCRRMDYDIGGNLSKATRFVSHVLVLVH